jgi:hypothetical protein
MDEQQDRKAQTRKLGRRGKGGGMTPRQGSVPFVVDPETGMKIFFKEIEVGKDGIQTFEMKAKGGRVGLRGGGICKKGMNKKAVGKNS